MAHFAELDSNNKVLRVIVVGNKDCEDSNGLESEAIGIAFCRSLFGSDSIWVQTSYNSNTRNKFAVIGGTYDQQRDAFISPQPYPSWLLNETTLDWEAPVPMPEDGIAYAWDESVQTWTPLPTIDDTTS